MGDSSLRPSAMGLLAGRACTRLVPAKAEVLPGLDEHRLVALVELPAVSPFSGLLVVRAIPLEPVSTSRDLVTARMGVAKSGLPQREGALAAPPLPACCSSRRFTPDWTRVLIRH